MRSERRRFAGSEGHELSAQLDLPDGEARAQALFAHCFTCNKNYKAMAHLSRALVDAGVGVLRFDFTGLGESGGEFAETTFTSNVGDLGAAAAYLVAEGRPPFLLVGHSLGGAAAIQAAGGIDSCRAVVTIAAPSDPRHLAGLVRDRMGELDRTGQTQVTIGGRSVPIRREFIEDLARHDLLQEVAGLGCALLVLHSPADRVVAIENAGEIYRAARHPKSFVSLDTADHLLSDPGDGRWAGELVAAWATRYLPGPR